MREGKKGSQIYSLCWGRTLLLSVPASPEETKTKKEKNIKKKFNLPSR
jgi:hypothetical protein